LILVTLINWSRRSRLDFFI